MAEPDDSARPVTSCAVSVSAGKFHTLVLVQQELLPGPGEPPLVESRVYSFGSNEYGQLGRGKCGKGINLPSPECLPRLSHSLAPAPLRIVQVATGDAHSIILSEAGAVFTFGFGGHGRLGHGNYGNRAFPTEVSSLQAVRVTQVSAGGFHTAVLSDDGCPYTCGSNRYGQLGQGDSDGIQATFTPVQQLKGSRIVQVATGGLHSFFLGEDRRSVYSCGSNRYGQLGHQDPASQVLPLAVSEAALAELEGRQVQQLSAGTAHSALLTSDGRVFTFGWGANGRLGQGDMPFRRHTPTAIAEVEGLGEALAVSAGDAHTAVLTCDGAVFSFGSDDKKQLGHKSLFDRKKPELVQSLSKCESIACGSLHTVAVAAASPLSPLVPLVYSWGNNSSGQLGHGDTWDQSTPKLLAMMPDMASRLPPAEQAPEAPVSAPPSPMSPARPQSAANHEGIASGEWSLTELAAVKATAPELRKMLQASHMETAKQLREKQAVQGELMVARQLCETEPQPASCVLGGDEVGLDAGDRAQLEQALGSATTENDTLKRELKQATERVEQLQQDKLKVEGQLGELEGRVVELLNVSYGTVCSLQLEVDQMAGCMHEQAVEVASERRAAKAGVRKAEIMEQQPELEELARAKQVADEELAWARQTISALEAKLAKLQASKGRGRSLKA